MASPTRMTPDWIARVVSLNPCLELENDNVRLCPVRLGFPHLDKPQPALQAGQEPKYGVTCLFQPGADIGVLKAVAMRVGETKWPGQFAVHAQNPNFFNPFQDQGAKDYEGFTPGLPFVSAAAERKPSVVTQAMGPYTERTYPGQWAFVIVRPFAFETKNAQGAVLKRGISMGLQSVMIIAEDEEFGGGGIDPNKAFAGVQIDANVNPAAAFNNAPGAAAAPASVFG